MLPTAVVLAEVRHRAVVIASSRRCGSMSTPRPIPEIVAVASPAGFLRPKRACGEAARRKCAGLTGLRHVAGLSVLAERTAKAPCAPGTRLCDVPRHTLRHATRSMLQNSSTLLLRLVCVSAQQVEPSDRAPTVPTLCVSATAVPSLARLSTHALRCPRRCGCRRCAALSPRCESGKQHPRLWAWGRVALEHELRCRYDFSHKSC
eukprot:6211380-Pleurochrysis_carterae.AAC.3